jgi:hypothetical protein
MSIERLFESGKTGSSLMPQRASGWTGNGTFRTQAGHGPHLLRDDLNRFAFLLGRGGGERLRPMTRIPGRPGTWPRSQGSLRAANLVVDHGLPQRLVRRGYPFAAVRGRR